jgi:hypothetical protein
MKFFAKIKKRLKNLFNVDVLIQSGFIICMLLLMGAFIYFSIAKDKFKIQDQNVQIETVEYKGHEYVYMFMVTKTSNQITQSSGLTHSPDCSYCNNITYKK